VYVLTKKKKEKRQKEKGMSGKAEKKKGQGKEEKHHDDDDFYEESTEDEDLMGGLAKGGVRQKRKWLTNAAKTHEQTIAAKKRAKRAKKAQELEREARERYGRQMQQRERSTRQLRLRLVNSFYLNESQMLNLTMADLQTVATHGTNHGAARLTTLHQAENTRQYERVISESDSALYFESGVATLLRTLDWTIGLNARLADGNTLLSRAILDGCPDVYIQALIDTPGFELNTVDGSGVSPLVLAIRKERARVTYQLLRCERVDRDEHGLVLQEAMRGSNTNFVHGIIRRVVRYASNVNTTIDGVPVLQVAYYNRHESAVIYLLRHTNININQETVEVGANLGGSTFVDAIIWRFLSTEETTMMPRILSRVLARPDFDINAMNVHGYTQLMRTVMDLGAVETLWKMRAVTTLLEHPDIDVNMRDHGSSALSIALRHANVSLVRSLFAMEGASPDFPVIIEVDSSLLRLTRNNTRLDAIHTEITRRLVRDRAAVVDPLYNEALVGLAAVPDVLRLARDYVYDDELHLAYINRPL
jgi:tRNA splicing endonuclease